MAPCGVLRMERGSSLRRWLLGNFSVLSTVPLSLPYMLEWGSFLVSGSFGHLMDVAAVVHGGGRLSLCCHASLPPLLSVMDGPGEQDGSSPKLTVGWKVPEGLEFESRAALSNET